ncbi:MAG: hypothetical protein SRB2_01587 [Desulfobacteraceae bacterium Eth-SRB2]|nr:MAG: hypothetical protein SRB2_01587 [Desulfobacteraceae bacterium Eth-SRB2]
MQRYQGFAVVYYGCTLECLANECLALVKYPGKPGQARPPVNLMSVDRQIPKKTDFLPRRSRRKRRKKYNLRALRVLRGVITLFLL